jgi:hypothetical protein
MPPPDDCKFDEAQFYDIEDLEDVSAARSLEVEKEQLITTIEKRGPAHRKYSPSSFILKILFVVVVGSCIALIWMFRSCLPDKTLQQEDLVYSNFRLVKDAVSAPTSGVTEDFQVYQPVFTPSGATDETTTPNGSENTTTVAQTDAANSCQVLLMNHSFAFSYGAPFVGQ